MFLIIKSFLIMLQVFQYNILQVGDSHCTSGDIIKQITVNHYLYAKGGKTYHYFNDNFQTVKKKIEKNSIQMVIISLGTNDCFSGVKKNFKKEVETLVDSVKKYCMSILLTSPPYNKKQSNMRDCSAVLKEVADEKMIMFYDLNDETSYRKYIAKDKVHYSAKGYRLMGQLILEFLMRTEYTPQ